ncbi:hypothetical protein KIPB_010426 [Kipferlia bialata]|uniref:Pre-mRNA-splicing factor Syf1/CRNKL1-like C-terminal HAT-repeats domain-containing protein n=1 Tax=Kipferlia bialata TaxID=797122 RepID=A0A9K3D561_9EUKA|nr:hypothetical protein KIPB_010426 [Kipferlia bialata]|eukprot:g10426.t1
MDGALKVHMHAIKTGHGTVQMIMNCAHMLHEAGRLDDCFRVLETGVSVFPFPEVLDIWTYYTTRLARAIGKTDVERVRDCYYSATQQCPPNLPCAALVYFLWARWEKAEGRPRRALEVLQDGADAVEVHQSRYELLSMAASWAGEAYGVLKARSILEQAINVAVEPALALELCFRLVSIEEALAEASRSRDLYKHMVRLALTAPDQEESLDRVFSHWKAFEVAHGNEASYKQMLIARRTAMIAIGKVTIARTADQVK